jgi:hypothetical protein
MTKRFTVVQLFNRVLVYENKVIVKEYVIE